MLDLDEAPRSQTALERLQRLAAHDARECEDQHAREERRHVERLRGVEDEVAEPRLRPEELGDDDADQPAREPEPQPGHDDRKRRGEHHLGEDLHRSRAERPRRLDEVTVGAFDAGEGVEEDREDRDEQDDSDLRLDAELEPEDEQRSERDRRGRVEERDPRIEVISERPAYRHGRAERDAGQRRGTEAERELEEARADVELELATGPELSRGREHARERHEEQPVRDDEAPDELPQGKDDDDRPERADAALVPLEESAPPRPRRRRPDAELDLDAPDGHRTWGSTYSRMTGGGPCFQRSIVSRPGQTRGVHVLSS